mgnify:CR=1 FL=1|uniref:TonB-dependent receptor n=1 Tax=candidate division WOR-3 bacterium TaxID=2052148 RepID=A0A7C4GIM8_UNCW3
MRLGLLVVFLCAAATGFAAETGRVAGRVVEKWTGEPLAGVNVVVDDATGGAATDANGKYSILNVAPGRHRVTASMVGYGTVVVTDVEVEPDRTARVDFRLEPAAIGMPPVKVRAERPLVSKDMTAPRYAVRPAEMAWVPGDRLTDMVLVAPGVARTDSAFHVRGGRATEVDFLIDGVSVLDPLFGELAVELARGVADEVVFMPGGFPAEYGRAMSGVINMITVNPREQLGAGYRLKTERLMPVYYNYGYTEQGLQLHLPVLPGLRLVADASALTTEDWDPRLFKLPHKDRVDYSLYGKLFWDFASAWRLALTGVLYHTQFDRYKTEWRLRLNDYRSDMRASDLEVAKLTWMPDAGAHYSLTLSRLATEKRYGVREPGDVSIWRSFVFRDTSEFATPVRDINNPWGCPFERYWFFYTGGTYEESRRSAVQTLSARLAGENQLTSVHRLSAGANAEMHDVRTDWARWPTWHPVLDTYRFRPSNLALYVQDRMDFEGLYADVGLRYDRFDPAVPNAETVAAKSRFSPRLGMSFRITDWLFLRANYGHYFQVPQFSMLYDNTVVPVKYRTAYGEQLLIVGNPNLKPERTQSTELGLQGEVAKGLLLTANLWRKDVYDLVGTREVPALPQRYVTYFNVDYARLTGVELIGEVRRAWAVARLSYTLSWARGTSSYANEAFYEFIQRGDTAPMVEYPLDFDQRNRFFGQLDLTVPAGMSGIGWLDAVLDSFGAHVIAYMGNGFPYSPPGGKGDPATWNTRLKPWRSNVDAALSKPVRLGRLSLNLVAEVLNVLDIRDIMNVYAATGQPNDDGIVVEFSDFFRPEERAMRFLDKDYDPRRDTNKDGYITQFEDYRSAYLYHKATIDWVNNYGPGRRARLGFTVNW